MTRNPALSIKMNFRHLTLGVLLSAVLMATCWSVLAASGGAAPLDEVIQERISDRHPNETPEWWRSLGADAPKTMIALFDKNLGIYQRLRLVEALGWFSDPQAVSFLKSQADNAKEGMVRDEAIRALGNSAGAAEEDYIATFLNNDDPKTRLAAAQALKKIGDVKAAGIVDQYLPKETMPWVKDKVLLTPLGHSASMGTDSALPPGAASQAPLLELTAKPLDELKADFHGKWKGLLILPSRDTTQALSRKYAEAIFAIQNKTGLTGEIRVSVPAKDRAATTLQPAVSKLVVLTLDQVSGKGNHISGFLKGDALQRWGAKSSSVHFEAELNERAGTKVLRLEATEILLTTILRAQ